MEFGPVAAWVAVVITLAGILWHMLRHYINGKVDAVVERVETIQKKVESQDKKHDLHFESIRAIENTASAVGQKLIDHEKVDDERFGRIEAMFAETRSHIVDILKAVNGR